MGKNLILVLEWGWILSGIPEEAGAPGSVLLRNAHVVRVWTNGKGIGGLANPQYKHDYTLDFIGDVAVTESKILFTIPCAW